MLGNNQTSTDVKLTTSGDAYIPGVVFIATELYAPQVAATKTVDKPTANLGEELTYTARFENTGADGAAGFVATDAIPDGTTYVSGSLAIDGVAQTDAGGDDRAEFDMAGDRVVARLGTGATRPRAGRWRSARRARSRSACGSTTAASPPVPRSSTLRGRASAARPPAA